MKKILEKDYKYNIEFRVSIIIYTITVICSLIQTYISLYLGGGVIYSIYYLPVAIIILYILTQIAKNKIIRYKSYIFWFILFAIIYFIYFQLIADTNGYFNSIFGVKINAVALQIINIIPVFFISWFILENKDWKFNKNLSIIIMFLFFVNFILTLKVLKQNPIAAKLLATGNGGQEYLLKGASGFSITYSAVLLVPIILFLISESKKIMKFIYIIFLIITIIYIYNCSYMTAIIATVMSIFIYLFLSTKKTMKIFIILLAIIISIIIINKNSIYDFCMFLSNKINLEEVSMRFKDIANMIKYDVTGAKSLIRFELYKDSINAFIESPIIGIIPLVGNYSLSGHSTFLDILGGCGIIGFIPFILSLFYSYKASIRYIINEKYKICIKTNYLIFIFISTLNPQFSSASVLFTLLIFMPILPNILDKQI